MYQIELTMTITIAQFGNNNLCFGISYFIYDSDFKIRVLEITIQHQQRIWNSTTHSFTRPGTWIKEDYFLHE